MGRAGQQMLFFLSLLKEFDLCVAALRYLEQLASGNRREQEESEDKKEKCNYLVAR